MKETYNRTVETNPSYISSLASPMRQKHRDDLLVTRSAVRLRNKKTLFFPQFQEDSYYNAWEGDIAIVNIFFGKEAVMGGKEHFKKLVKLDPLRI